VNKLSHNIQELIQAKRKIRRQWQQQNSSLLKFNQAIKILRLALREEQNQGFQNYLSELSATERTDYSLWKTTRSLKRPERSIPPVRLSDGNWARSDEEKANAFAAYLMKVFSPHEEQGLNVSHVRPIKFRWNGVKNTIRLCISPKKAPGYDLITGKMIRELPDKCIKLVAYIFNAIM